MKTCVIAFTMMLTACGEGANRPLDAVMASSVGDMLQEGNTEACAADEVKQALFEIIQSGETKEYQSVVRRDDGEGAKKGAFVSDADFDDARSSLELGWARISARSVDKETGEMTCGAILTVNDNDWTDVVYVIRSSLGEDADFLLELGGAAKSELAFSWGTELLAVATDLANARRPEPDPIIEQAALEPQRELYDDPSDDPPPAPRPEPITHDSTQDSALTDGM